MRLERISENQIRCTLTKEDLESRGLALAELAYGTDKARRLFQDMMRQAEIELDFRVRDMPLMIEAVPLSGGIMLLITRVTNPEEFDARLASFAPSVQQEAQNGPDGPVAQDEGFDRLIENIRHKSSRMPGFRELSTAHDADEPDHARQGGGKQDAGAGRAPRRTVLVYEFDSVFSAIQAAMRLDGRYEGESSLYRDPRTDRYCLVLMMEAVTPDSPQLALLTSFMEYSDPLPMSHLRRRYLQEHCELLCKEGAVSYLAELGGK